MLPVRLFFEKTGPARYMSHLDLVRCFGRSLRRAAIPFWYTEGFNPHPFLTFALPLSLGTAGMNESVDIKLTEDMPFDALTDRLNRCLPEGLRITSVAEPKRKATDIAFSSYKIVISEKTGICDALTDYLSRDEIITQKKNKKKQMVDINLKPSIHSFSVSEDNGNTVIEAVLSSGCSENLNPTLLLDSFSDASGIQLDHVDITRFAILCADGRRFA